MDQHPKQPYPADDLPDGEEGSLFLNDITKLDCAIFDPGHGVVGASWHVDVVLTGVLDPNGFVYDFSLLKKLVRQTLKESVDHALVIPIGSQTVQYNETPDGEQWTLETRGRGANPGFKWSYSCPKGAVYPIRCVALTNSVIEQELARLLKHRLPASISDIRLKLRAEAVDPTEALFRYTHGISGHDGLCQRLFHGHRSRIEVYLGDSRRADLEHYVVTEIFGTEVHVATPQQLQTPAWTPGTRGQAGQTVILAFRGSLGSYGGSLPAENVWLIEQETSIECISRTVAQILRKRFPKAEKIKVMCYEGIGKGGIGLA